MCVYMYIYIYVCVYMYIYIYVCVYMYIYIYICVCIYVYIYIYMCVYICICIGYHMRGEVISVLSLERRYHILSRVSAANEGQNMIS